MENKAFSAEHLGWYWHPYVVDIGSLATKFGGSHHNHERTSLRAIHLGGQP
ncbi:Hypothetical protein FKW44_000423 [Caligus rogercresseyi]|uniref:Uncharacterized protein n=1 Tax=Caligus rogercresseyi TaxID=217165 RepID=A0A7T8KH98_CALRO|nr:Hypothetical protein FKW44_000423 [Caligus rogercresseyi]